MSEDKFTTFNKVLNEVNEKQTEKIIEIFTKQFAEVHSQLFGISTNIEMIFNQLGGKKKMDINTKSSIKNESIGKPKRPITFAAWFQKKFEDEEFRDRVINDDIKKLIEENKAIKSETNEQKKQTKIKNVTWDYIKKNKENNDLYNELEEEWKKEKSTNIEQAQQEVEHNTDEEKENGKEEVEDIKKEVKTPVKRGGRAPKKTPSPPKPKGAPPKPKIGQPKPKK